MMHLMRAEILAIPSGPINNKLVIEYLYLLRHTKYMDHRRIILIFFIVFLLSVFPVIAQTGKSPDLNGDGSFTLTDISFLISKWGTSSPSDPSDRNSDGKVNGFDFTLLIEQLLTPSPTPPPSATPIVSPATSSPSPTPATTYKNMYYVSSSSGNDANPGTISQPWKSLAKTAGTATAGDGVFLKRGDTWNEALTIKTSGTSGSPVVFDAYGSGNRPKLTAGITMLHKNFITFKNLHIDRPTSYGINIFNGNTITVEDVEINLAGKTGIFAFGDNLVLRRVKSCGAQSEHGLYLSGSDSSLTSQWSENALIEDSEFCNNAGAGIQVNANTHRAVGTIARRNKLYGNQMGMNIIGDENGLYHHNLIYNNIYAGVYLGSDEGGTNWQNTASVNTKFYNNTVYNAVKFNWSDTIYVEAPAKNIDVKNNIVNAASGLIVVDSGSTATFDYNCYYRIAFNGTSAGANSANGDSKFVNATSADFHLQSTSPCIDKGVNLTFTADFDGSPVPSGARPDMGAFEFH